MNNKGSNLPTHNQYTPGPTYDSRLIPSHGYPENVAGVFAKN